MLGNGKNLDEEAHASELTDEHENIRYKQCSEYGVHEHPVVLEQEGPRGDAVDHKAGQQDGGGVVSGNAEGHQGNQSPAC